MENGALLDWICADCGYEQASSRPCEKCHSVRTVLRSVIEETFGKDWKKNFEETPDEAA